MNMHTSYTLTHTHMDSDARGHSQLYTYIKTHLCQHAQAWFNTHAYTCTHAFMQTYSHTHANTYTHTLTHTCTHAQAVNPHVRANANTYTCIQNKNTSADTTCIHTQIHSHANTSPRTYVSTQNL